MLVLLSQSAFFIHQLTQSDVIWVPEERACIVQHTEANESNVTMTFSGDLFFLVAMLFGLLRMKEARRLGLWKFLWNQGLIWIALATVAEAPTVVFLRLNLNQVMNVMFFTPEQLILVIGATRMYRTLSDFTKSYNPSGNYSAPNGPHSGAAAGNEPDAMPMHRVRVRVTARKITSASSCDNFSPIVPLEVDVRHTFEEHFASSDGKAVDIYYGSDPHVV